MTAHILTFVDYTKPFLLETDACNIQFNFELEYQRRHDNTMADALS